MVAASQDKTTEHRSLRLQTTDMHDYKKLKIWQESANLAVDIYKSTKNFPKEEMDGLTNQMRRAVVSVSSNIAEGSKRTTKKDFKSFLAIAHGSGAEVESQLYIAKELDYITEQEYVRFITKLDEIMRMIAVFSRSLSG